MKTFILILLFLPATALAQKRGYGYSITTKGKATIHKTSGKELSSEEVKKLLSNNPGAAVWPVYDKWGNVKHFILDPDGGKRQSFRDPAKRVGKNEKIPPFVMTTTLKKVYDSEKITNKFIILCFQSFLRKPLFNPETINSYSREIEKLQANHDIIALLVTMADSREIAEKLDTDRLSFEVVPRGAGFLDRYHVLVVPTVMVIGPNNNLIGYLDNPDASKISELVVNHQ